MKALMFHRYGPPEAMTLDEVPMPVPRANEVLVKVHAASVNSWDWELLNGTPFVNRITFGLFKPKIQSLGADIAGTVEAAGEGVTKFRPGDAVCGDLCESGFGGFAEYVCAPVTALTRKPPGLSFEEAAALPQAGLLALQGLSIRGGVQAGQQVLINGAGGGVGSFAVRIAKSRGAEVTGVDSTIKQEAMRGFGADTVLDYTREDFTRNGRQYDFILDMAFHRALRDCRRALKPGGVYVVVGGSIPRVLRALVLSPWISRTQGKHFRILAYKPNRNLEALGAMLEAGTIKVMIERRYPLSGAPAALRHLGEGRALGKLVVVP